MPGKIFGYRGVQTGESHDHERQASHDGGNAWRPGDERGHGREHAAYNPKHIAMGDH